MVAHAAPRSALHLIENDVMILLEGGDYDRLGCGLIIGWCKIIGNSWHPFLKKSDPTI